MNMNTQMVANEDNVNLLVIGNDKIMGDNVLRELAGKGYTCRIANETEASQLVLKDDYQVILVDMKSEHDTAVDTLRELRKLNESTHIILLTPLELRQQRNAGLEAGADDFLITPFALSEMQARVEAALIRRRTRPRRSLEFGPISMDLTSRKVSSGGRAVSLTPTEFRILELLMRSHGEVVTRKSLCESLWEPDWEGVTNVIEVHINRLRNKLRVGSPAQLIRTVRGKGYCLNRDYAASIETTSETGAGATA